MTGTLKRRLRVIEQRGRLDEVVFTMPDGTKAGIPRRQVLRSMIDGIRGIDSTGAWIMRRAVDASDGSSLHSMCQALAKGPREAHAD